MGWVGLGCLGRWSWVPMTKPAPFLALMDKPSPSGLEKWRRSSDATVSCSVESSNAFLWCLRFNPSMIYYGPLPRTSEFPESEKETWGREVSITVMGKIARSRGKTRSWWPQILAWSSNVTKNYGFRWQGSSFSTFKTTHLHRSVVKINTYTHICFPW